MWLDTKTGTRYYMLSARELFIVWGGHAAILLELDPSH